MPTINEIHGFCTMIIFIYAIYIVPKAVGESRGIYMEQPEEFYGRFKSDCKWTHGTTYLWGTLSFVIGIPILLLIWDIIRNSLGILIANIALIIILILIRKYYIDKKVINNELAYKKNIEEGYLKSTDPMPNVDGRITKIIKHFRGK